VLGHCKEGTHTGASPALQASKTLVFQPGVPAVSGAGSGAVSAGGPSGNSTVSGGAGASTGSRTPAIQAA